MVPLPKCCSQPNSNPMMFKKPSNINDKDYISNLPDDCLFSIFEYLNHEDLDLVSSVSQKINAFASSSRPKTKKKVASELKIYQKFNGDFVVNMMMDEGEGESHYMCLKNYGKAMQHALFVKHTEPEATDSYNDTDEVDVELRSIPCFIHKCIHYLSDRFNINSLMLIYVLIDHHFLKHCTESFAFQLIINVEINGLEFDPSFNLSDHKTFMNWIASLRPKILELKNAQILRFGATDVQFLERMIQNGNCDYLVLDYNHEVVKEIPLYPLPYCLWDDIAKFSTFIFECFFIDAECLVEIVFNRLKQKVCGNISLSTTNEVTRSVVRAALEHEEFYERYSDEGDYMIMSMYAQCSATFYPWNKNGVIGVDVEFGHISNE